MSNNFVGDLVPTSQRLILDISVKKLIQGFLYNKSHNETDPYIKNFYLQSYPELKGLKNEEDIANDTIKTFINRLVSCRISKEPILIPELSDQDLGEDTKIGIENRWLPSQKCISIEEQRIAAFLHFSSRSMLKSGKIKVVSIANEINFMDCIITEDNASSQRYIDKYWKDFYRLDKDLPSYQVAKKEFSTNHVKPRFVKFDYLEKENLTKVGYLDTVVAKVILKKMLKPFFAEANAIAILESKDNKQTFVEVDLIDLIKRNVPSKYNTLELNDNLCLLVEQLWDEEKNKFDKIKGILIPRQSLGGSSRGR